MIIEVEVLDHTGKMDFGHYIATLRDDDGKEMGDIIVSDGVLITLGNRKFKIPLKDIVTKIEEQLKLQA